jgi:hypothetical protein
MASPMLQEIFAGSLIGLPDVKFNALGRAEDVDRRDRRRLHGSLVAVQHRRTVLLGVAIGLYRAQEYLLHVLPVGIALTRWADAPPASGRSFCSSSASVILSMYGGGFATVPAYLADMFERGRGRYPWAAPHCWSTAGIIGPVVVNYIREFQLAAGVPRSPLRHHHVHPVCDAGCRTGVQLPGQAGGPVAHERGRRRQAAGPEAQTQAGPTGSFGIGKGGLDAQAALFWACRVPLAWGRHTTLLNAAKILRL